MDTPWTDLINTQMYDWRGGGYFQDRLSWPLWQNAFLQRWSLQAPVPMEPADRAAMMELRDLLQLLWGDLVEEGTLDPENLAGLNRVMTQGHVVRQLVSTGGGYRVDLRTTQPGWSGVMAEIASSFSEVLARGEPERIKICANRHCLRVFVDETRSRTKRYCDEKTCGNLLRVRHHRQQQRKKAAGPVGFFGGPQPLR